MNVSPTLATLLGALAVFLSSPYWPTPLLTLLTGNVIGAALLLIAALAIFRRDLVLGLAWFLAVAALFLEQRRRTVVRIASSYVTNPERDQSASVADLSKPAPNLIPNEVHPQRETAEIDDVNFEPSEHTGSNSFESPAESINEKHPLETVPPHPEQVSEFLQEKGFASVH